MCCLFLCNCVSVCVFMRTDVYPPCRTGLDLRGWARRLAKGWGPRLARLWLQRMSSVYREMEGRAGVGGTYTAAFTLYCKPHTHIDTHALTQKAVAALETPQALQCVCVCLCYSWPSGTSGSDWQPYTHQFPRLQLNTVQAGWARGWWMLTDQAGCTRWVFFSFSWGCSLLS